LNFYKHHIGDYAQATSHLSFIEDAAYSRCIRKYYAEEAPLPADPKAVQRLVGARTREERAAVQSVLDEFFELRDDGWHNKRCDEELAKANAQAEANRKTAMEREERRRQRQQTEHEPITNRVEKEHESLNGAEHESLRSREPSQTPDTRHQTPDSTTSVGNTADLRSAVHDANGADGPGHRNGTERKPKPGLPECPHQELIALYRKHLPHLRQPVRWDAERAEAMRTRWRECAQPTPFGDGYRTKAEGLAFWDRFFAHVAATKKLRDGITSRERGEERVWKPDLEWLVRKGNFTKIVEGAYQ
jgi:uncharacterized protein YdaU (DUF1376 family)